MDMLADLWLPILLCGIALFFASFLAWAILPTHKPEWKKLPNEDEVRRMIEQQNIAPGQYLFPYCDDPKEMKDPEKKAKYATGCQGMMTIFPGPPNMGAKMAQTVIYFLVVSFVIAYVAGETIAPGASFLHVFQIVGTIGVLAHASGQVLHEIWFTPPLRARITCFIDGVAYGLITGAIFAWLWPAAPAAVNAAVPALGG
ncbi:MAG: hypothetical protein VYC34_10900 [Planctomycetota bacterium]|nr:hypothetical protein [Planctomycetota bacterium]